MTTGLKQTVEAAMQDETAPTPVEVSDEAIRALSVKMRQWSGWTDSTVVNGVPVGSPYAECDHSTRTFTANMDNLVLNPHRVLLTVTPFRLKQEAVLTGALLHEAGHARFTRWKPRTEEAARTFKHSDGTPVSRATMALASLMEEPRVEGLMAQHANLFGATDLDWTMRASAAHLLPMTSMAADPDQRLMGLITSWALRAGRQHALHQRSLGTGHRLPLRMWVRDFTELVQRTITEHLLGQGNYDPYTAARSVINHLIAMTVEDDHKGTAMVDTARYILGTLFPETDGDDQPEAGAGCTAQPDDSEEQEDSGSEGEQSDSEGDTDQSGEGESDSDEGESDSDEGESGEGESDEGESDEGESDEGDTDSDEGKGEQGEEDPLSKALRELEEQSKQATETEAEAEAEKAPAQGAGTGGDGQHGGGWRAPSKEEREVQRGAERFLRTMIDASETSKVSLTEAPSATVDGAALAAWKAGGQVNDPRFFRRTRREIEPSPPVKIAILVDISGSMEMLQGPSALLSWALASAARDLRNFAGRGQRVESCLIHWGFSATVIQGVGDTLPGIREVPCVEGTLGMHTALDLVEEQMPGFFAPETQENRLLVQFTDWELWVPVGDDPGSSKWAAVRKTQEALAAGVNMLSVVPKSYNDDARDSALPKVMAGAKVQRGKSSLLRYNPMFPDQVWEHASKTLV